MKGEGTLLGRVINKEAEKESLLKRNVKKWAKKKGLI
jgi:hypothetical protein